jgi:GxxExxY protein
MEKRLVKSVAEEGLIYPVESYAIKGAAMEVYKRMGNGYLEAVYQECLEREFLIRGIPFVAQHPLALTYRSELLEATYKPDFICYGKIIVEIKAVAALAAEHQAQLQNYLKATSYEQGFLFNFGKYPLLEQVRMANTKNRATLALTPSEELDDDDLTEADKPVG